MLSQWRCIQRGGTYTKGPNNNCTLCSFTKCSAGYRGFGLYQEGTVLNHVSGTSATLINIPAGGDRSVSIDQRYCRSNARSINGSFLSCGYYTVGMRPFDHTGSNYKYLIFASNSGPAILSVNSGIGNYNSYWTCLCMVNNTATSALFFISHSTTYFSECVLADDKNIISYWWSQLCEVRFACCWFKGNIEDIDLIILERCFVGQPGLDCLIGARTTVFSGINSMRFGQLSLLSSLLIG